MRTTRICVIPSKRHADRCLPVFALLLLLLLLLSSRPILAQDSPELLLEGDKEFWAGKFDVAAEKYRAALEAQPANVRARYWLVRALLRKDKDEVLEALTTIEQGLRSEPENPVLLAGLGEVRYRMGEFEEARTAFLAALSHDSNVPRARLGLGRILLTEGRYKSAKFHLQRAYELDPNDPEVILDWSQTLNGDQEEIQALRRYLELAKNEAPEYLDYFQSYLEFLEQRENPGPCKLSQATLPAQIKIAEESASGLPRRDEFRTLYPASRTTQPAPFVQVAFNGTKPRTLMLDTGASGILLSERLAREAGIRPIAKTQVGGIGGAGGRKAYYGLADRIRIGGLEFQDCVVRVTAGQHVPRDGLIGTVFFDRFLITLDLQKLTLRLDAHPEAQAIAENPKLLWGYDRKVTGERAKFEPVRRTGGHLLMKTRINQVPDAWFLLDTGASFNSASLLTAKKVTRTSEDPYTWVQGVSGRARAHESQSITIEFASFRQANFRMITLDLNGLSKSKGFEVSGILGYPTLRMFTLQIDYLNALVNFAYAPKK